MILLFGAIILLSAFLRAIESGTLFTISDSGMKRALNKVLEQYFRIFARHKELEKYFRDLLHLRLWWVVNPPFPISNWKYGRYLLHRLSENQTLEIQVENSQTGMIKQYCCICLHQQLNISKAVQIKNNHEGLSSKNWWLVKHQSSVPSHLKNGIFALLHWVAYISLDKQEDGLKP